MQQGECRIEDTLSTQYIVVRCLLEEMAGGQYFSFVRIGAFCFL